MSIWWKTVAFHLTAAHDGQSTAAFHWLLECVRKHDLATGSSCLPFLGPFVYWTLAAWWKWTESSVCERVPCLCCNPQFYPPQMAALLEHRDTLRRDNDDLQRQINGIMTSRVEKEPEIKRVSILTFNMRHFRHIQISASNGHCNNSP